MPAESLGQSILLSAVVLSPPLRWPLGTPRLLMESGFAGLYLTVACPRSHSWQVAESGFGPRPPAPESAYCSHTPPTYRHSYVQTHTRSAREKHAPPSPFSRAGSRTCWRPDPPGPSVHEAALVVTQACTRSSRLPHTGGSVVFFFLCRQRKLSLEQLVASSDGDPALLPSLRFLTEA